MRGFMISACSLAALLCSTSAFAGGAADAVSYTWTGLYGGINAGWGWHNSDWDFSGGGSTTQETSGGIVGLQVGYDAQIGNNLFAGIEGSLDAADINDRSGCFGTYCRTRVDGFGDVSLRLGVISGPALIYLKGGYAYESTSHYVGGGSRTDDSQNGYLLGVGAEYPLMYNLTTKLEYNYIDFGSNDSFTTNGVRYSAEDKFNLVKLGFNFKFD